MISYVSTRGRAGRRSFEEVLLAGLAEDGGLFVPETWPEFDFTRLAGMDYADTAAHIMAPFAEGCFSIEELTDMAREAYAGFGHPATAPLRQLDHDRWLLELFHGPTLAFKDFALQLLGRMFERVLARRGETITIVGATSGDTGSAAIHACAGRNNMRICILHPKGRVSEVQRRQMTTERAENVLNLAVDGTFDDCQDRVKDMFNDMAFRREMRLAAVNSINFARLAAQAAYYAYAALRLGGLQQPLSFSVPTGNFGDVYSGYIAHRMGLPVAKLLVATNRNDILARFFATGDYRQAAVSPTMSPSMDIQIASNFERLLFEMHGRDGEAISRLMEQFKTEGSISVARERLGDVIALFAAKKIDEDETSRIMNDQLATTDILVDPHTAVGVGAGAAVISPTKPLVTLATAHPAKFPDAVGAATGQRAELPERMADLYEREERYLSVANDLAAIQDQVRSWGA